jgi:cytochrome c-type biogenesis protein CcmH
MDAVARPEEGKMAVARALGRPASERPSVAGWVVLAAILLAAGVGVALVVARGPAPPATLQERVRLVAEGLRCPVCQNLSVADSSSRLAKEMRGMIAADLRAGRSPEEIRAGFVDAYGEWILLEPPARGIDLVAWVLPFLLLAGGVVRGRRRRPKVERRRGRARVGTTEGPGTSGSELTPDERASARPRAGLGRGRARVTWVVLVASAAVAAVAVLGVMWPYQRTRRIALERLADPLEDERGALLRTLRDLDDEHQEGALGDEDYRALAWRPSAGRWRSSGPSSRGTGRASSPRG